jgi:hypothetical protein
LSTAHADTSEHRLVLQSKLNAKGKKWQKRCIGLLTACLDRLSRAKLKKLARLMQTDRRISLIHIFSLE